MLANKAHYAGEVNRRINPKHIEGIDLDLFDGMEGQLTQTHIDNGKKNNCRACPVALALNDMLAEYSEKIGVEQLSADVNMLYVYISIGWHEKVIIIAELSGLIEEWIRNYDTGQKLPPGNLYIEKDGLYDGVDGGKIQHWSIGIDVPDAYYIDPLGDDNTVNWGV